MQTFKIPAWEWYGWRSETVTFPDGWNVHEQKMQGHGARSLEPDEIAERMEHPVGTPRLSELAKGSGSAS